MEKKKKRQKRELLMTATESVENSELLYPFLNFIGEMHLAHCIHPTVFCLKTLTAPLLLSVKNDVDVCRKKIALQTGRICMTFISPS